MDYPFLMAYLSWHLFMLYSGVALCAAAAKQLSSLPNSENCNTIYISVLCGSVSVYVPVPAPGHTSVLRASGYSAWTAPGVRVPGSSLWSCFHPVIVAASSCQPMKDCDLGILLKIRGSLRRHTTVYSQHKPVVSQDPLYCQKKCSLCMTQNVYKRKWFSLQNIQMCYILIIKNSWLCPSTHMHLQTCQNIAILKNVNNISSTPFCHRMPKSICLCITCLQSVGNLKK